jgi:hypothetical protein
MPDGRHISPELSFEAGRRLDDGSWLFYGIAHQRRGTLWFVGDGVAGGGPRLGMQRFGKSSLVCCRLSVVVAAHPGKAIDSPLPTRTRPGMYCRGRLGGRALCSDYGTRNCVITLTVHFYNVICLTQGCNLLVFTKVSIWYCLCQPTARTFGVIFGGFHLLYLMYLSGWML